MELLNATRMAAGLSVAMEPSGRELLVVVIKGTFRIPELSGETLSLNEEQVPLVMSDIFFGEPGRSAPKYEVDFAPRKQRCDILLNGSAYAPAGTHATRVIVGLSVGSCRKSFRVVGNRVWESGLNGIGASPAIPFATMPVSFDVAFGGTDDKSEDPSQHVAYTANPTGRGFHSNLKHEWVDGSPLPNTEELDNAVSWVNGNYRPMAFGAIGRHWEPRFRFAGTYDQAWVDRTFPFLPSDFDERYYQAASLEQQLPIPVGRQEVTLLNLTPDGRRSFVLPHFEAPVHVFPRKGAVEDFRGLVDTIVIEPDQQRVTMTWRIARPFKKNALEVAQVLVGHKSPGWWRARELGKAYYSSLDELARDSGSQEA